MFVGSDAIHSLFPVILQIRMLCGQPVPDSLTSVPEENRK